MHVDGAQAKTHEMVRLDEVQDLLVAGDRAGAQGLEQFEDSPAVLQIAAGEFAQHKRVAFHAPSWKNVAVGSSVDLQSSVGIRE